MYYIHIYIYQFKWWIDRRKDGKLDWEVSRWESSKKSISAAQSIWKFEISNRKNIDRVIDRIKSNQIKSYHSTERTWSPSSSPLLLLEEPPGPYSASPLTESTITLDRSRRFCSSTNDEMRSSFVASVVVSNRKPSPFPSLLLILITTISFRGWFFSLVQAVCSMQLAVGSWQLNTS